MKICLVHDDFLQEGGAERLFAEITKIFPNSPIYTSLVDKSKFPKSISSGRIHTSFLQKIPFAKFFYKALLLFYPMTFENFNFDAFDVVLTSTTRFAKSIITKPKTMHICYINSLPRFLYDENAKKNYLPKFLQLMLSPIFWWLKKVDNASAARVDLFIANSKNVAQRVKKIYKRDTRIIHPFADTDFFKPNYQTAPARLASENVAGRQLSNHQSYFLVVNRLVRWKKIDIAIEACTELNQPLIIVGTGPDGQRLKKLGSRGKGLGYSQVQFAGNVSNEKLKGLYQNAKALIVTQEEDFGISAVESLACGTPIIAYRAGGQVEILENRKTGLFFNNQTAASLKDAISTSTRVKWSSDVCRKAAQKFSKAKFISSLKEAVYANFPK